MSEALSETPTPPGGPDAGGWSYRTGDWFGVFGAATTLLLPASEKGRIIDLWAAVDDGAPFDTVLDALLQRGLGALPGFVLVGFDAGPDGRHSRVLVRGRGVRASVHTTEETVEIEAPSDATWAERTLAGVTALQVVTDAGGGAEDLPIVTGLVRVSRIDHPAATGAPSGAPSPAPSGALADVLGPPPSTPPPAFPPPAPPSMPPPAFAPPVADGVEEPTDVGALGAAAPVDVPDVPASDVSVPPDGLPPTEAISLVDLPEADPGQGAADDVASEEPVDEPVAPDAPTDDPVDEEPPAEVVPPLDAGWAAPPPPPADAADPDDLTDAADASDLPPAPTGLPFDAPPPPGVTPAIDPEPATDHDGLTQAGFDPGEFARVQPGIPGQPMAPSLTKPVARLVVSDGQSVDVDRVILIGRAPEARRFTSTEQPLLITVPSPLHEISSTHVEIRPGSGVDHGTAVVTDMGSTNGTVLVQPGLGPEDLKPGIAVQLIPGATINLGDGVIIDVTRP